MPPWAAMLCARRGLSWKQKHWTWYPSSARVAAAEAPASPEPTTSTSNRRLLAGLTSFISKRCLSHFWVSGPEGMWASSFMSAPEQNTQFQVGASRAMTVCCLGLHPSASFQETEQHREGDGYVTEEDQPGRNASEAINHRAANFVLQPHGLEGRADAMTEVQTKQAHGENVKTRNQRMRKTGDHHSEHVVTPFRVVQRKKIH